MLIFAMSIGTLFPSGLSFNVGIILNSSKISLALVLVLVITIIISKKVTFYPNITDKFLLNFIGWIILGCIINGIIWLGSANAMVNLASNALSWILTYFSFYFAGRLIANTKIEANLILKSLLKILVLCALVGLIESIFRINFYGLLGKALGLQDAGSGTELWRGNLYRARSSLDQSIAFAYAMLCGFILTDYLAKVGKISQGTLLKLIFVLMVILSGTRSALLSLVLCIGFLNYKKLGQFLRGTAIIATTATTIWMTTQIDQVFYIDESLLAGEDTLIGQSGNLIGRFKDIDFILKVLDFNPIFGIGMGLLHNDAIFSTLYPELAADYDGALDNMVLSILAESGILGLLMAIIAFFGLFRFTQKINSDAERVYLSLMLFLFFAASISYDLLIFPGTGRMMLLLIALGMTSAKPKNIISKVSNA